MKIGPDDCLHLHHEPCKCKSKCCQWVKEPYVDWCKVPCWLDGWEHAVVEEKCPFCKAECTKPGEAECCEVYGIMTKKKLVYQPKKIKTYRLEPKLKWRWVRKCVKCGMVHAGGPFREGGPYAEVEVPSGELESVPALPPQTAPPGTQNLNRPEFEDLPAQLENDRSAGMFDENFNPTEVSLQGPVLMTIEEVSPQEREG